MTQKSSNKQDTPNDLTTDDIFRLTDLYFYKKTYHIKYPFHPSRIFYMNFAGTYFIDFNIFQRPTNGLCVRIFRTAS